MMLYKDDIVMMFNIAKTFFKLLGIDLQIVFYVRTPIATLKIVYRYIPHVFHILMGSSKIKRLGNSVRETSDCVRGWSLMTSRKTKDFLSFTPHLCYTKMPVLVRTSCIVSHSRYVMSFMNGPYIKFKLFKLVYSEDKLTLCFISKSYFINETAI